MPSKSGETVEIGRNLLIDSGSIPMGKVIFVVNGQQCFGYEVSGTFLCSTYPETPSLSADIEEDAGDRETWLDLAHRSLTDWARENPY